MTGDMMIRSGAAATQQQDERGWIAAAQHGDVAAFNTLVSRYQSLLFHTAFRILGDADAASDAAQEAFISAYNHIRSFRGESLSAWLARIVTNACYDQVRVRSRRPWTSLDSSEAEGKAPATLPTREAAEQPEAAYARHELNDAIQTGISNLPAEQRMVLVLADIDQFSYAEIAEITQTNIGTVKSRLNRARFAVRDHLLHAGYAPHTRIERGERLSPAAG